MVIVMALILVSSYLEVADNFRSVCHISLFPNVVCISMVTSLALAFIFVAGNSQVFCLQIL